MPTVEIVTAALPPGRKRAVAVRLTRWFVDRGMPASHVVVSFTDESSNSLFSGGMPIDAMGSRATPAAHARVVCCIGVDRDGRFRDELADELVAALGAVDRDGFVYVEFRLIESPLVYLTQGGRLNRADQLSTTR